MKVKIIFLILVVVLLLVVLFLTFFIPFSSSSVAPDNELSSEAVPTLTPSPSMMILTSFWKRIGESIDGESAYDRFGFSLSLSNGGKIVAIGAPYNDDNGNGAGHVRVFQYDDTVLTGWEQMGDDIDGQAISDNFGTSVSLSDDGKIVAIGAPNNASNGNSSGHVRVFQYNDDLSNWVQMGDDINGEAEGDYSGSSISLSVDGKIVAIAAINNDGNGNDSGHVRVLQYNDDLSNWVQMGDVIDGETVGDRSGRSLSLSNDGKIVAIGAPYNADNGLRAGHVRVFQYDGTVSNWVQMGEDIDGEAALDNSGNQVSLSDDGKIVAIAAIFNDDNGNSSGHVRVFQYNDDMKNWLQMGDDINGEAADDYSGTSISLSDDGKTVAIGAEYNDNTNFSNAGHVRVFQYDDTMTIWVQIGEDIDGEESDDRSGKSVSLSGDGQIVAIGAYGNGNTNIGNNSGRVRVYGFAAA